MGNHFLTEPPVFPRAASASLCDSLNIDRIWVLTWLLPDLGWPSKCSHVHHQCTNITSGDIVPSKDVKCEFTLSNTKSIFICLQICLSITLWLLWNGEQLNKMCAHIDMHTHTYTHPHPHTCTLTRMKGSVLVHRLHMYIWSACMRYRLGSCYLPLCTCNNLQNTEINQQTLQKHEEDTDVNDEQCQL